VEAARGAALLVPPGDATALAAALRRAALDGALRARLAEAGLARAAELDWSAVAARVLHVYRAAAAARSPAGRLGAREPAAPRAARLEALG
jgi:glycosyltransferase involved in cell wall biosynthesis